MIIDTQKNKPKRKRGDRDLSDIPEEHKEHYCKNADLLAEVLKCQQNNNTPSEQLGKYFLAIAWRLSGHSNFRGYAFSLKEDFVAQAVYKMLKALPNFKSDITTNAFAYFTQVCWISFVGSCKEYYKQINIKKNIFEKYLTSLQSTNVIDPTSMVQKYLETLTDSNKKQEAGIDSDEY